MSLYHWSFKPRAPLTLLELDMMRFSGAIREKYRWWEKIENPSTRRKWKAEARQQAASYVIKELRNHYLICQEGKIGVAAVDGTYQADYLIPSDFKNLFLEQIAELEADPLSEKMWHPDSNEQVLDLVHPSMHCFVADKSCVYTIQARNSLSWYDFCCATNAKIMSSKDYTEALDSKDEDLDTSKKYQWLPAEFKVDLNGKVSINSYINNLHPIKYRALYASIGRIFEHFVPLFEQVLTDLPHPRPNRVKGEIIYSNGSHCPDRNWEYGGDEEPDHIYEARYRTHLPQPSKVPKWQDLHYPGPDYEFKGRRLQVIVKLANIILSPEKPSYKGGSWHVEGMKNERIVATGIYYYDSDNISESRLNFRCAIETPRYNQDDRKGVKFIYGLPSEGQLNQVIGSVITSKNRCLVFPNIYQHQVQPFELVDKSKPGYRKILVFFLVDPAVEILSTALVPPQQTEWYRHLIYSARRRTYLELVPDEILAHILKYVDGPMSQAEMTHHICAS